MTRAILALALLLPLTSGCIAAAAALPLAAGAAVIRGDRDRSPSQDHAPRGGTRSEMARSDYRVVPTALTALPPPTSSASPGVSGIAELRAYTLEQAAIAPGSGERPSALLATASELRPARANCGAPAPAVFVDLDPGRGTFDPLSPGRPNRQLATALADMRARGVMVVWLSRLGDNFAKPVRDELARSGLDPAGGDQIVLMRTISERKQSRRDEVARAWCPIAIVGDERADFDELYLYLKNPDAAAALDTIIGKGWFLASPFEADAGNDKGVLP